MKKRSCYEISKLKRIMDYTSGIFIFITILIFDKWYYWTEKEKNGI